MVSQLDQILSCHSDSTKSQTQEVEGLAILQQTAIENGQRMHSSSEALFHDDLILFLLWMPVLSSSLSSLSS